MLKKKSRKQFRFRVTVWIRDLPAGGSVMRTRIVKTTSERQARRKSIKFQRDLYEGQSQLFGLTYRVVELKKL